MRLVGDNNDVDSANAVVSDTRNDNASDNLVPVKAFSMNMPFAALLLSGIKTLETRNNDMLKHYPPGTKLLLHVGRRTYPDQDKHMEILRRDYNDTEIASFKSLQQPFCRGQLVAIVEIGTTREMTLAERCHPSIERKVTAYGADSGRIVTEIRSAEYLQRPLQNVPGQSGVFDVHIPPDVLPKGWEMPEASSREQKQTEQAFTKDDDRTQPVYSISG